MKPIRSIKKALKNISFKQLNSQIKGYGYEYSFSKYITQVIMVLAAIVAISYFYMLELPKIIVVAIVALIAIPVIILSQFSYMANNDRFEQMVNYMDQMILSFKRTPKILYAMESTLDMIDGEMKTRVERAIHIIKTDKSEHMYENAFRVIENEFKCSRLRTLHRFILNVERENSKTYQESIDNLYFDIRAWVTRTYQYQANLKATKGKILIVMGLSLGIAAVFASVLAKAENTMSGNYEMNIVGNPLYQFATMIFLILFIILYAFMNSKINGHWLINDISNKSEKYIEQYIIDVEQFDAKANMKKSIIAAAFGVPLIIAGLIISNRIITVLGVAVTIFMFLKGGLMNNSKKKAVERELIKEFPIWMRDIAINLNHMVVLVAVKQSRDTAAPVLRPFLDRFIRRVEENPTDIKPYLNFLEEFKVSELSTAVKTLYSIQTLSPEDSQRQINDLITRNQTLLENSEKIRNDDSIAGVSFISMIPMLVLSMKLMVDLGVMMIQFLSLTSGAF